MLVATPRDYFASCHEMKEDKRTRAQCDLFQSNLEGFAYFGSEVRTERNYCLTTSRVFCADVCLSGLSPLCFRLTFSFASATAFASPTSTAFRLATASR